MTMATVNYDRAAAYYDRTRAYRPGVAEHYRDAVLSLAPGKPRILEMAIGTGLIAAPFLNAGDDYIGVDFSRKLMLQVAGKIGKGERPSLAQADIAVSLPFAADSFDLAQAVRVFHLLEDWRRCIQEARRLLKPGGALLIVHNVAPDDDPDPPPWALAQGKWDEILRDLGVDGPGRGRGIWRTDDMMQCYLRSTGASAEVVDLLRYRERAVSPRIMVNRRRQRMFSSDWQLPPGLFSRAIRRLDRWLDEECPTPDAMAEREMVFRAVLSRWAD